jgi:outer membrane protein assembly factor BamB
MLKRLIIAVFGISLVLAFVSIAFADSQKLPLFETEVTQRPHTDVNNPKLIGDSYNAAQPAYRPSLQLTAMPPNTMSPNPSQVYFCDFEDYSGGPYYVWTLPDPDIDFLNTRFSVEAGFACTLKVAHVALYKTLFEGSPGMRVSLWADNGFGLPGALLEQVDVSNATIMSYFPGTTTLAYVPADFSGSGWVFADGDQYHYGISVLGGVGDVLCTTSDDGLGPNSGQARSSAFYAGSFYSMLDLYGQDDYVFDIVSERCCNEIPFSDCYTQEYFNETFASALRLPHPVYGDSAFAMRFDVGGPETLQSVDVGMFFGPGDATAALGDDDVRVTVYDDDGFGHPGAMLAQVTIPGGTYPSYPAEANAVFGSLVLDNTFHIAISTSGIPGSTYERLVIDVDGAGASRATGTGDPTWPGPTTWYNMPDWWGEYSFLIRANLCRDEFADCAVQDYYGAGDPPGGAGLAVPNATSAGIAKWAQKFTNAPGGSECELRQLFFAFTRIAGEVATRPLMYTQNTLVHVVADGGGMPSSAPPLFTGTLTPADYAAAGYTGSGFVGDIYFTMNPNVAVPGSFWVVFEPLATVRAEGIRVSARISTSDPAGVDNSCLGYYVPDAGWFPVTDFFGGTVSDAGANVEATVCCIPFTGRVCAPTGDDWSTRSHDQARTGASQLAIGDAWCDLNVHWFKDETVAGNQALTMAPIVHGNRVYQILENASIGSSIRVYNLVTGALEQIITGIGNFAQNDPLIVGSKLYIAGGTNATVYRYDISVPGAAVLDWSSALIVDGPLRRADLILLNIAGTDVLYGASLLGSVFAINESDGSEYIGWLINPITLDANTNVQSVTTDGSQLFFGTGDIGLMGDVWAINPATGATNWKLSSAGFQGNVEYGAGAVVAESFPNVSVEAGILYVGGLASGAFPVDGLFYRLDAITGAVLSVDRCSAPFFSYPIIDINLVYLPTRSLWSNPNIPNAKGSIFAFNKGTGQLAWNSQTLYESHLNDRNRNNALLTCEPEPASDIIVAGSDGGYVKFLNSLDGSDIFSRRWDFGGGTASRSGGTAIGSDSLGNVHILVGSLRGALVDLTKGIDDRARLEIQDYDPVLAVIPELATSVIYNVPNIITNTGCANLVFNTVTASSTTFGSTDPGVAPMTTVRPDLLNSASVLAEQIAFNSKKFAMSYNVIADELSKKDEFQTTSEESFRIERGYRAALVPPAFLNGVIEPYAGQIVPQGDSIPLILDINPNLVFRGPNALFIQLNTNDADFFLNSGASLPSPYPQLTPVIIGGCVTDSTAMHFGDGGANYQFVFNAGTLSDHDGPFGFNIEGDAAAHWMSGYIYGVSSKRLALNMDLGAAPNRVWISWQADPNWCDTDCKPSLTTGVSLGAMWNGASYTPINGNVSCASGIDSVQHFGSPWDWNVPGPFNQDSTMGLKVNTRTIGAVGTAGQFGTLSLGNLTVEILEFTERNNRAVPGWKFGFWGDIDLSSSDMTQIDISHSVAWQTVVGGAGTAWGMIKLPYGCGYAPLKNAVLLDSDNSFYNAAVGYLNNFYLYCEGPPGLTGMPGASGARDQSLHVTLVERDVAAGESFDFAVAQFGLHNLPSTLGTVPEIRDLADLTNKWVGFGRGDVNDDEVVNLSDIMILGDIVGGTVPGAIPFAHLGDVDADNDVDNADLNYLINYYFGCGPCPLGDWQF